MFKTKQVKKRYWLYRAIIIIVFTCAMFIIWQTVIKPFVLTWQHGDEMYNVLVTYEQVTGSVASHRNPDILSTVAKGDALEYLQKYRCQECPTVPVVIGVNIENLKVLKYTETYAEVFARVETGVISVHPVTLEAKGTCRVGAIEGVTIMVKENKRWKISGGRDGQADTWTPIEELRDKVCPEEYDLN